MVHRAEPAAEVDGERDVLAGAAPPVCAGGLDEQVADHGAERARGILRTYVPAKGRGDNYGARVGSEGGWPGFPWARRS